jgi:hypothetical protein
MSVHNLFRGNVSKWGTSPILKLQNDLFIASFKNYSAKYNKDFNSQTTEKKLATIENAIQKTVNIEIL